MAGDEGGVGYGRGEIGGGCPPSRALVADVEAGFETRQYIIHEFCVGMVEQEGCHTPDVDWRGRLQGGRRGSSRRDAGLLSCAVRRSASRERQAASERRDRVSTVAEGGYLRRKGRHVYEGRCGCGNAESCS